MKQVIINADDFGLARGINLGIIRAHTEGIVTSTSVVVNGNSFDEGVALLKKTPSLGTGIHLNLTLGKPLLPKNLCKTLVDSNGCFFSYLRFIRRVLLKRIDPGEIKKELQKQIERFLETGFSCFHIDTHKHIGYIPLILDIILELAEEFQIRRVRFPNEVRIFPGSVYLKNLFDRDTVMSFFVSYLVKKAGSKLYKKRVAHPEYFFGITLAGFTEKDNPYASYLKACQEGVNEIMCHPSVMEEHPSAVYGRYGSKRRYQELQRLTDPELKEIILQRRLKTISFRDIPLP
jgi:predicted glycoside hydrolase/deacetylase ChbG (UPF0249 family)